MRLLLPQEPGKGKLHHADSAFFRDPLQFGDSFEVGIVPVAFQIHLITVEARTFQRSLPFPVLTRQKPSTQRVVADITDSHFFGKGQIFLLDTPRGQVIHGLRNPGLFVTPLFTNPMYFIELPGAVV